MEIHSDMISVLDVVAQILIAMALVFFAWRQHSTTRRIQQIHRVHDWGIKCLDIFSECEHTIEFHFNNELDSGNFLSKKIEIMKELSSLINQGRLFYGNVRHGQNERGKYPAQQGYRSIFLDPLVAAYETMSAIGEDKSVLGEETLDQIRDWRRFYISLLQEDVNSKWLKGKVYAHTMGEVSGYSVSANSSPPSWNQYMDERSPTAKAQGCRWA